MQKSTEAKTPAPSPKWLGAIEDTLHAVDIDFTAAFSLVEASDSALYKGHYRKAKRLLGAAFVHLDCIGPKMKELYEAHQEGRDALVKVPTGGKQPCQSNHTFAEARQKRPVYDRNQLEGAIGKIQAEADALLLALKHPGIAAGNPSSEERGAAYTLLTDAVERLRSAATTARTGFYGPEQENRS